MNIKIKNKQVLGIAALICNIALGTTLTSCNNWLDVRPETEQKEEDQFSTENGFQMALIGCYLHMASQSAYGLQLTMTSVENMANLWRIDPATTNISERDLAQHDYTTDNAKSTVKGMYTTLFKTIAEANLIIKNAKARPEVFNESRMQKIILGEAYAIRAYCQLDILRLFGQVPNQPQKLVSLPYSEATNIDGIPAYYDFEAYTAKLKSDIETAEELLKESDPATLYPYNRTYATGEVYEKNAFLANRQMRLNYWAVRALHARMALYTGDKESALTIARELITSTLPDGTVVRKLSGLTDYRAGYTTCPNECYFSISKANVKDYTVQYFTDNANGIISSYDANKLILSAEMLDQLFQGENIESHNRYNNLWNRELKDGDGYLWVGFKRYSYDEDKVQNKELYYQIIPMLRTSEMYLIAMETSTDLEEINRLYKEYMISHNVPMAVPFTSTQDVTTWIENEYRREFYGEGQMFYTYKRMGETNILWSKTAADESTYVIPLPETEYDPSTVKKEK